MNKRRLLLLVLLATALLAGACSDDDNPAEPDTPVVAEDPTALMNLFLHAQQEMDADLLGELLHADAKVFVLQSTLFAWEQAGHPLGFTHFGRDSLLAAHGHLFSGQEGSGFGSFTVPPVISIGFDVLDAEGIWEPYADPGDDFPGHDVSRRTYQAVIYFHNPDYHRWRVETTVDFYAAPVTVFGQEGYQLLGWREWETTAGLRATEVISWSDILTWYR
jgi:hypothetical protein